MADKTQTEINNLVYDIKLAEQQVALKEIFSETILGWGVTKGFYDFNSFFSHTGGINFSDRHLSDSECIMGLSYMTSTTSLYLYSNKLTDVGVLSGLVKLKYLHLAINSLTDIGDISGLIELVELNLYTNSLTDIGNLKNLVNLEVLNLYNNSLTDIGSLVSMIKIKTINLKNNSFDTAAIDQMLEDLVTVADTQIADAGLLLTTIDLSGNGIPTDGASNANYLDLIGLGISVTIQTT